jgi:hypothetical protein
MDRERGGRGWGPFRGKQSWEVRERGGRGGVRSGGSRVRSRTLEYMDVPHSL